jgi:hypothetical protein
MCCPLAQTEESNSALQHLELSYLFAFHEGFLYQAAIWRTPRRVVAKVELHAGEPFPRADMCSRGGWSEARSRPLSETAKRATNAPNRGHGDRSLTREGGNGMVLQKDRVEIGDPG